ncbi:hypothetical protein IKF84_01285 [Candidatus Saccharibacteria bacterium]|nr:hypothetical protein [Candidatus Saccharibacteria bacterium]
MNWIRRFGWIKYVIAFLVPVLVVLSINQHLDNDSWDVLAQGRYIVENGIYHEDVLSMHEGLHTVVQNYAFSVVFYWIHLVFGASGIYIAMILLFLVLLFLLYKVCMLISDKNVKLSLVLMAVTGSILALEFVVTRAQMIDYVVFMALIYVMELYIKTGRNKYLWWIPGLSIVLVNFHASVWWIIFAIIGTYIIDGFRRPKKILQGYRLKPLILISVISAVVGLINPYGVEMVTSIFAAYGGMSSLGVVSELASFNPMAGYGIIYYLMIVIVVALYAFAKRRPRVRYLLLFFGFLFMGLSSVKGMSEFLLVMFFPLAYVYKDFKIPKLFYNQKIGRIVTVWVGVLVMCISIVMAVRATMMAEDRPNRAMEEAMDVIDNEVGDKNKRELKIYVGYNQGGYVEYRGYPAYLDPRGAEFMKSVNGKDGILEEWIGLDTGKTKVDEFLGKYDFDFLVIEEYYEEALADLKDERYELIYSDDENETRVYKKVEAPQKV